MTTAVDQYGAATRAREAVQQPLRVRALPRVAVRSVPLLREFSRLRGDHDGEVILDTAGPTAAGPYA